MARTEARSGVWYAMLGNDGKTSVSFLNPRVDYKRHGFDISPGGWRIGLKNEASLMGLGSGIMMKFERKRIR